MKVLFLENKILLFLGLFFSISSFAQSDIVGKWETRDIIGYSDVLEYSLLKEKRQNNGRNVTFKPDGTFFCDASVKCLNDCFIFTYGTYTHIDNEHIQLIVKDAHFVGLTCKMKKLSKENIVRDLGVFYIYKEGETIRLIPSNGILEDDKRVSLLDQKNES
ncbi:hypothetical protein ABXT06_13470 [Flavobacterium sp. UW10123]|uniref:hypothetical protein n=1 Tax=Flavobacterium sp. UW10123 TaxID=3230800 RepID=UPI00339786BA